MAGEKSGITIRNYKIPKLFGFTTTAGRVFEISSAARGSKFTRQISPRLGFIRFVIDKIVLPEGVKIRHFRIIPVSNSKKERVNL
jgi:hypothetical protein